MASYSIDWLFNRVYDLLLWCKYAWLFGVLRTKPEEYIAAIQSRDWDGLRDRGWFDEYFAAQQNAVPPVDMSASLWQKLTDTLGFHPKDSDHDGIPDISDPSPYDPLNASSAQLKERYQVDYAFSDKVRDFFGLSPKDSDNDGVPDSYERAHGMNDHDPDTDHDGLPDGQELLRGTDPRNNDTDHDLVLDGRDEAPLDPRISSQGLDSDGDGVSDAMEKVFAMDPYSKDTDSDGIPDGMDTYPLDPTNTQPIALLDFSQQTQGLQWHIQNPVLSFFASSFSLFAVIGIVFLIFFILLFVYEYWSALVHYEHHFNDSHSHGKHEDDHMPAGIAGLPIGEFVTPHAPDHEEFKQHPRWAIIEGYMASPTEALWRIGILEADTMLDEVLREKGYKGADVGELLNGASFKTVQLAWDAHKIRNRIAHDGSTFPLSDREAKRAHALYEAVFKELKAI